MPKLTKRQQLNASLRQSNRGTDTIHIGSGTTATGEKREACKKRKQSQDKRAIRDRRLSEGCTKSIVQQAEDYFSRYLVFSAPARLVASSWCLASYLAPEWDRFPHLAVTSPEKRCGKTRLLQLVEGITPNAINTTNISPAAVYRVVEKRRPTLLLDEAQSLSRRGSEASEVLREILNGGIDRDSVVYRCGGGNGSEIHSFSIYCPKVIALIGELDGVLSDRCLPIPMKRKLSTDTVEPYRSRLVAPKAEKLATSLEEWAESNRQKVAKVYDHLEPFQIENDRLAELLLPLQAVLTVADPGCLVILEEYADLIDKKDIETETPGVRMLIACHEIFKADFKLCRRKTHEGHFISTAELLSHLVGREEEPWLRWSKGSNMSAEALARLLRPYGIRPTHDKKQTMRGYYAYQFKESWSRYTLKNPV